MKSVLDRIHVLKMLCHKFHKLFMLQVTGRADDQIAGGETLPIEAKNGIRLKCFDRILGSRIGLPSG